MCFYKLKARLAVLSKILYATFFNFCSLNIVEYVLITLLMRTAWLI